MSGLRWSRRATEDLLEIGDFIATENPAAARAWVERLRARAAVAARAPRAGRMVPEIGREDVRETFLKSYRIVYRVLAKEIVVATVFEGHRRFPPVEPDAE